MLGWLPLLGAVGLTRDGAEMDAQSLAASLLAQQHVPVDAPRVLELGAGCQDLGRYLVPGATYIASDQHPPAAAHAASLRCDFNRGQFPRVGRADVVAALGVVEYMCQPAAFLRCAPTQPQEPAMDEMRH